MCPLYVIRKLKADRVSGSFNTEGTHLPTVVKSNKTSKADHGRHGPLPYTRQQVNIYYPGANTAGVIIV